MKSTWISGPTPFARVLPFASVAVPVLSIALIVGACSTSAAEPSAGDEARRVGSFDAEIDAGGEPAVGACLPCLRTACGASVQRCEASTECSAYLACFAECEANGADAGLAACEAGCATRHTDDAQRALAVCRTRGEGAACGAACGASPAPPWSPPRDSCPRSKSPDACTRCQDESCCQRNARVAAHPAWDQFSDCFRRCQRPASAADAAAASDAAASDGGEAPRTDYYFCVDRCLGAHPSIAPDFAELAACNNITCGDVCGAPSRCEPCQLGKCGRESYARESDPQGYQLRICTAACGDDVDCGHQCYRRFPEGLPLQRALVSCLVAQCPRECPE